MKYTHYFGLITKEQGRLNLCTEEFQRLMNIVHIEGVISGLNRAKASYKDTNQYYRYDPIIRKYLDLLAKLTLDQTPDLLIRSMAENSYQE